MPTLNISLLIIKQLICYVGCFEHSKNNPWTITFLSFLFKASNNDGIESETNLSTTLHHTHLSSNKPTINLYSSYNHTFEFMQNRQHSTIGSDHRHHTHNQKHFTHLSPTAIEYDLHSAVTPSVPPNSRKEISLGIFYSNSP